MSIFGLMTRKEVASLIEQVKATQPKYPDWLHATADTQQYDVQHMQLYENQADLYRRMSWVLAAITHVASEAALVDFDVERLVGEETTAQENHPFEMLMRRPNPLDSRYEFLYGTVAMKKLTGNAYWWLNRTSESAPPDELWLIPSHMIVPVPDKQMYLKGYVYYPGNGQTIALEPWEIVHFRSFNFKNRFVGMSAIESLAQVAIGDIGMQTWNTKYFTENNARLPGILTFQNFIAPDQWEKIKQDTRDAAKKRELMLLQGVGEGGVNWLQNAVTQKDMEFLLGRKANRDEIWTVLAPGLASMLDTNATEANAIAGRATFRERAVYPELVAMQEKITTSILPSYGDNLYGAFEDIRYVDRQLELQEMAQYEKSHTIEEIRKEYYSDKPLGDDRDDKFPVQITADTGRPPEPEPEEAVSQDDTITQTIPPTEQNTLSPEEVKALVEIDRWSDKSMKAGKITVWHNVSIPDPLYKAIKAGEMTFEQAREKIKHVTVTPAPEYSEPTQTVPDYSFLLDAIKLEVQAIKAAPQPSNITIHNHPGEPPIVNVTNEPPITNITTEPTIVNIPEQPPAQVTVKTEAPAALDDSIKTEAVEQLRKLAKKSKK